MFDEEFMYHLIFGGDKSHPPNIQAVAWPATSTPTPHDIICSVQFFIAKLLAETRLVCQLKQKQLGI